MSRGPQWGAMVAGTLLDSLKCGLSIGVGYESAKQSAKAVDDSVCDLY